MCMFHRRWIEAALRGRVSASKVRILLGARQTGKTALLAKLLAGPGTHVVNLQDTGLRRRFEADPAAFAREVRALPRGARNVLVDEIQKVPALLDEVQALYDASPSRWQFFLTGSSARRLKSHSANLLPGRSHLYRLFPVSAWELAREDDRPALALSAGSSAGPAPEFPTRSLARTLQLGCLPGVRAERPETAKATLAAYVEHYLEEEIRREALVRDVGPFIVFLRLAAIESGGQINLARLSQESGIPASTLKNFYQVLVDTFVGYWIPAYSRRSRKRLLTAPRFYFFDVGVRNAAAELPQSGPIAAELAGPLLEQWVAQELVARAAYLGRGQRVSFWRTTYGVEVDFVWETPRGDIPIEVKWTERPRPGDARHLEIFLDEFPSRARRGLIVCRCERAQQLTDRVRAIPWHDL
ncbi:MAG: ATP-binding protein [Deltaproteobacteria bacterium]|nr:ATP-binding protein [Deltaproteobacteria bacterium]